MAKSVRRPTITTPKQSKPPKLAKKYTPRGKIVRKEASKTYQPRGRIVK